MLNSEEKQAVWRFLEDECTISEEIFMWDSYCRKTHNMDEYIYPDYDFDEVCDGMTPTEIIETYGGEDRIPEYFTVECYGLESAEDGLADYQLHELGKYIIENNEYFGCESLIKALNIYD